MKSGFFTGSLLTLLLADLVIVLPAWAQTATDVYDYDFVATRVFWQNIYVTGGWTLYCGFQFDQHRKTVDGKNIAVAHIYPPRLVYQRYDCRNRSQCRERGNVEFMQIESDLHNMYPVWNVLNVYSVNSRFGLIDGEDWRFDDCDIEWLHGVTEPRPIARGNIARALLYMHHRYGVPLDADTLRLARAWNHADPPSVHEKQRNDLIEKLQGRRNPFIDNPDLADQLRFTRN